MDKDAGHAGFNIDIGPGLPGIQGKAGDLVMVLEADETMAKERNHVKRAGDRWLGLWIVEEIRRQITVV